MLENGKLNFEDIIAILKQHFRGNDVSFQLDCCYSGKWCDDAQAYFNKGNRLDFTVRIEAMTDKDTPGKWGEARKVYGLDYGNEYW